MDINKILREIIALYNNFLYRITRFIYTDMM